MRTLAHSLFTNKYTYIYTTIMQNPNRAEFLEVVKVAEASAWPFISRIRAHCLGKYETHTLLLCPMSLI